MLIHPEARAECGFDVSSLDVVIVLASDLHGERGAAPVVLGNDLAGVVVAASVGVTRFAVGDEVYARPDMDLIGTFAELIAINQDDVAAKPATLTLEEAASIPVVG